jgi:hypothetical protein
MNPDETKQLLGEIAVIDNRKLSMDAVKTWHDYLSGFTLAECREALAMHRKNAPDQWVMPGHLVAVIRRKKSGDFGSIAKCAHGIPLGTPCHDCTHGFDCSACMEIPGLSDAEANRRAAVRAMSRQIERRSA